MPSGRRKVQSPQNHDDNNNDPSNNNDNGTYSDEEYAESDRNHADNFEANDDVEASDRQAAETEAYTTHRHSDDEFSENAGDQRKTPDDSNNNGDERLNDRMNENELQEHVDLVKKVSNKNEKGGLYSSTIISGLMDQYLNNDYTGYSDAPPISPKPRRISDNEKLEELENNLKNLEVTANKKKQPPPPIRNKPQPGSKTWSDPKDLQRMKSKEKSWPPREEPKDIGAYVAESYGQTDPYSNRLIKDIQKSKREEEEKKLADKRAEVVQENIKPMSTLRSTFTHKPAKPRPGMLRPEANYAEERSWVRHEKKHIDFDTPPDEPDWMKLIRNRRWNSTVKARFPCKDADKSDFERRSTTPKNWKRLAQDKNALKMLSEVVGIGAEGEELFMRLASQRQKIEDEKTILDRRAEEELMGYEVARESLGEDAAYQLQMDNPLPAARMVHLGSQPSIIEGGGSDDAISEEGDPSQYPFTTSQLEAAYLTNQLLRLHPEEFKKLMSLERSRQATLRWQFSADPFDSVHEHQSLPYEIAMLATQEPRVQSAMRRILAQGDSGEYYGSVFGSKPRSRNCRSEGGYASDRRYESDADGYESGSSAGGPPSQGVARGRPRKKKAPVAVPHSRGRSVSPTMMGVKAHEGMINGNNYKIPAGDGSREVQSHGLFSDEDIILGDEVAQIDQLTSNLARNIDVELANIESSLEDRKKGFFEDSLRNESAGQTKDHLDVVDKEEIASRRKEFVENDRRSSLQSESVEDIPKQRHKVRRISSNAQLNAVFGKRRQASESQESDGEDQGSQGDHQQQQQETSSGAELNDLVQNIQDTFGNA